MASSHAGPSAASTTTTIEESLQYLKDHLLASSSSMSSSTDNSLSPPFTTTTTTTMAAKVYVSSMHVLYTIKHEQQQIANHRSTYKKRGKKEDGLLSSSSSEQAQPIPFPSASVIPTIHSILYDPTLFQIFLRCLSTTVTTSLDASGSITAAASTSNANSIIKIPGLSGTTLGNSHADHSGNSSTSTSSNIGNRKRSLSVSVDASSSSSSAMMMTVKMPPHAFGTSPKVTPSLQQQHRVGNSHHHHNHHHPVANTTKPLFSIPVVVATIVYSVLEYYDHWPVPIMQVYADDCFGPRHWVDHKLCQLLTSNLALVAGVDSTTTNGDDPNSRNDSTITTQQESTIMAETYRDYWKAYSNEVNETTKPTSVLSLSKSSQRTPPVLLHRHRSHPEQQHHSGVKRQRGSGIQTQLSGSTVSHDSDSDDDDDDYSESIVITSTTITSQGVDDTATSSSSSVERTDHQTNDPKKRKLDRATTTTSSRSLDVPKSNDDSSTSIRMHQSRPELMNVSADKMLSSEASGIGRDAVVNHNNYQYPLKQLYLRSDRVRNRYYGKNRESAHDAIVSSLSKRLDTKSKQNSNLLQCLPNFMGIPAVRKLVAANLEKWLQSPALAGLARTLFICTVNRIKTIDPPLPDDLEVINYIIGMSLKSNQLNAHIERISAIAEKLPYSSVITLLYSKLLHQLMDHATFSVTTDQLKMIVAIHRVVPPAPSYDAIASVLLIQLVTPAGFSSDENIPVNMGRYLHIEKMRQILRVLCTMLGSSFDGISLIQALLSFQVKSTKWTCEDEEDKARLMFQCATLSITHVINDSYQSESDSQKLTTTTQTVRKLMLTYCCTEYGPYFRCNGPLKRIDYFQSGFGKHENENASPTWLTTMRCLLFIEPPESPQTKRFFSRGNYGVEDTSEWDQELSRIRSCYKYGCELHSDLIWIVLNATSLPHGIDAEIAIRLLENLLEQCSEKQPISLAVDDPKIIWELYNLVLFEPEDRTLMLSSTSNGNQGDKAVSNELLRLAFPGLWWRVTMIALVFCANSPNKIGSLVWREHPTIRAIIIMVTSQRFRFPTVDCDVAAKMEMKKFDHAARMEERRIAESLFLPPKLERKQNAQKGARVSRRILKQQQEKDAANELAATRRRQSLMDEAQKSIMMWDPGGPARKPPPESVDMLLVVNDRFHLSYLFQNCTEPDYLLMSIGQTTRSAIERAYTWLIPIVSSLPKVISRLPSSASCLLLMRAYSTQGEERKQLKELSAPLLHHVTESLNGLYGESHALKAFDLLMTDMASKQTDKRRCARKVLQDSLLSAESIRSTQSGTLRACMLRVLELEHAKLLVHDSVKHMIHAAGLESGEILSALIMALQSHIDFADSHNDSMGCKFPIVLFQLLSSRPFVCAEAMDVDVQLYELTIQTLHSELSKYANEYEPSSTDGTSVSISLYKTTIFDGEIKVPFQLLQSICVVLNIWKNQTICDVSVTAMQNFADAFFMHQDEKEVDVCSKGLASITFDDMDNPTITLETWLMLVKASSDDVARRAASSIPTNFLPRILLCSGLSQIVVLTIIGRLELLTDSAVDKKDTFRSLLSPPALSGWDTGHMGSNRDVLRRLISRISAYVRLYKISQPDPNPLLAKLQVEYESSKFSTTTKGTQEKNRGTTESTQIKQKNPKATKFLHHFEKDEIVPVTEDGIRPYLYQ